MTSTSSSYRCVGCCPLCFVQLFKDQSFAISTAYMSRMCGDGLKLHQMSSRLDIRKHFSIQRGVKHWNVLSREVKPQAYQCLRGIWTMLLPMRFYLVSPGLACHLDKMIVVGPFKLKYSVLFCSIPLIPFFIQIIYFSFLFYFPFTFPFFPCPFFPPHFLYVCLYCKRR